MLLQQPRLPRVAQERSPVGQGGAHTPPRTAPFRLYSLAQSSVVWAPPQSAGWEPMLFGPGRRVLGSAWMPLQLVLFLHSFMFSATCVIIVGGANMATGLECTAKLSRPSALSCLSFFITLSTFTLSPCHSAGQHLSCLPTIDSTRGPCFYVGTPTLASPASSTCLVLPGKPPGPACVGWRGPCDVVGSCLSSLVT